MGVPDFLRLALDSAGSEVDLRRYRDGITVHLPTARKRKRRNLRIGVDVSHWIYKATFRYGPMLAEEKHLSNYGRYQLFLEKGQKLPEEQTNQEPDPETVRTYVTSCCLFVIQRLQSLRNETNADILVVLDGATPPVKQKTVALRSQGRKESVQTRDAPIDVAAVSKIASEECDIDDLNKERLKANRRAGAGKLYAEIIEDLLIAMRTNQIPFLVAPYEADGQLAYLSKEKFIDLIITEDSDLVAQGGVCMLYKMDISVPNNNPYQRQRDDYDKDNNMSNPSRTDTAAGAFPPRGILLLKDDLGAVTLSAKQQDDNTTLCLMDMSDAILATLFVAAGSDYCEKLKGIGLVTACNIVRQSFLLTDKRMYRSGMTHKAPPLARVFDLLFQHTYDRAIQGDRKRQQEYKNNFLAALLMYRHPVVYDPISGRFVISGEGEGDPELLSYPPYRELFENLESCARVIGDLNLVDKTTATLMAEGWISPRTRKLYASAKTSSAVIPQTLKLIMEGTELGPDPQATLLENVSPSTSNAKKVRGGQTDIAGSEQLNKTPQKARLDSVTQNNTHGGSQEPGSPIQQDTQSSKATPQLDVRIGRLQETQNVNHPLPNLSKRTKQPSSFGDQAENRKMQVESSNDTEQGSWEGVSAEADVDMKSVSHLVANTREPSEELCLETQELPLASTTSLYHDSAQSHANSNYDTTAVTESQEKSTGRIRETEPVADVTGTDTIEGNRQSPSGGNEDVRRKDDALAALDEQPDGTADTKEGQESSESSPPQTQQNVQVIELLESSDDDSDYDIVIVAKAPPTKTETIAHK